MTKGEIVNDLNAHRDQIGLIDSDVVKLKNAIAREIPHEPLPDHVAWDGAEAIASITLAHRHLEDARMRLGKVIQALEGGVSILDHPEVKALIAKIRSS